MRAQTCLACRFGNVTELQRVAVVFAEALGGPDVHHHHTVLCEARRVEWFDDVTMGPLGVRVPSRRDSVMCPCPEDGREVFTPNIALVRVPEVACRCSVSDLLEASATR